MTHPPVIVVDEHDNVIGAETLKEVWKHGLYHRIVRIMVEDPDGRILLQKRAPNMDLSPGRWDHSAAGHVDEGDNYEQAAARELHEELGVDTELQQVATYRTNGNFQGRILNRFNRLYRCMLPADTPFKLQPEEVSEVRWFTVDEIKRLIAEHPERVTDGIVDVMERFY
ncbi:MAG TPA: NUDIX domain-containing protein [Candidatus Saccharimonadales bacterium]|nr:NUDIX domain-containing protein [Candidatus Saccharimonadales bacterium]